MVIRAARRGFDTTGPLAAVASTEPGPELPYGLHTKQADRFTRSSGNLRAWSISLFLPGARETADPMTASASHE